MTEPRELKTSSGIEVKPVHAPGETSPLSDRPGEYPFTRGIYPEMYRKRLWTFREYSGFGTSSET